MPLPAANYSADSVYLVFIQYYLNRIQYNEAHLLRCVPAPSQDLVDFLTEENKSHLNAIEILRKQMMAANGLSSVPVVLPPSSSFSTRSPLWKKIFVRCCVSSSLVPEQAPMPQLRTPAQTSIRVD